MAAYSFGGPAGQIAVTYRLVVEEPEWVSDRRFLHALNYMMALPGPEARQRVTYLGWLLHGTRGGLVAGWLFVLPAFVSILALGVRYVTYRELTVVSGLLFGLKAAILVVVFAAVVTPSRRVFENDAMVAIALAAFVGMYVFDIPFPVIIATAGVIGYLGYREMLDGIGLAETTPGPFIQVVQFVASSARIGTRGRSTRWSRGSRLPGDEHPEEVTAAIEALDPPIPPYAAFEMEPRRVYAPIIDDGVNRRVEVDVS